MLRRTRRLPGRKPIGSRDRRSGRLHTPFAVDVRFRLHRFAAHLVEHTQQVDKTLRALGQVQTDAQAYVRQISIIRGRHERRSPEGVRKRLDDQMTALAEAAGT